MKKEKPILFSTAMVQAILEGRKTQTRRVINFKTHEPNSFFKNYYENYIFNCDCDDCRGINLHQCIVKCPYEIGMRLWCRETWHHAEEYSKYDGYIYKADYKPELLKQMKWRWKPSIFMPREACRLLLEITDIEVERVQDITITDASREGIKSLKMKTFYKDAWRELWDSINSKRGYGWDKNPFVWVLSFKKI